MTAPFSPPAAQRFWRDSHISTAFIARLLGDYGSYRIKKSRPQFAEAPPPDHRDLGARAPLPCRTLFRTRNKHVIPHARLFRIRSETCGKTGQDRRPQDFHIRHNIRRFVRSALGRLERACSARSEYHSGRLGIMRAKTFARASPLHSLYALLRQP